jgi:hypothetical protein
MKKKQARRSTCNGCSQSITEKEVIKAVDAQNHIAAFGSEDTELVWVGRDGYSMCYASNFDTAHGTDKEKQGR